MAERRQAGLHPEVEAEALAGAIFGNVASGAFLALGVTVAAALGLTPIAFLIAGSCFLLTTLSYVEGITMLPATGGSSNFARRAFNELVSFFAGWALILDYMIMIALAAFFAAHYAAGLPRLAGLGEYPVDLVIGLALIAVVVIVNIRGVNLGASISIVLSMIALASQIVLVVVGMAMVFDPAVLVQSIDLTRGSALGELAFAIPIAMIGFSGLEVAANMSGELAGRGDRLPRPMLLSAVISVLLLLLLGVIGISALPVHPERGGYMSLLGEPISNGGYQTAPLVGIVSHLGLPGPVERVAVVYTVLLAVGVLFVAASTGVAGLSRLVYSMAQHRQLSARFSRIERSKGSPKVAVVALSALAAGVLVLAETLSSSAIVLAQLYAFGAMLSFFTANAAIVRLRYSEPGLDRPFRSPWNVRFRGGDLPLAAVGGMILSGLTFLLVVVTHDAARSLGFIWMVVGFVIYATYRWTHGLGLLTRYSPMEAAALEITAPPYRSVLMAVRPERGALFGAGDEEVVAFSRKLLDDPDGEVAVIVVHEIPLTREIAAPLGEVEQITRQRLGLIRGAAERLGGRLTSTTARGRAAGRTICQEAVRRGSSVIVMAMREKDRHGDRAFGRTIDYVIRHAPCDVVVLKFPAASLQPDGRQLPRAR